MQISRSADWATWPGGRHPSFSPSVLLFVPLDLVDYRTLRLLLLHWAAVPQFSDVEVRTGSQSYPTTVGAKSSVSF